MPAAATRPCPGTTGEAPRTGGVVRAVGSGAGFVASLVTRNAVDWSVPAAAVVALRSGRPPRLDLRAVAPGAERAAEQPVDPGGALRRLMLSLFHWAHRFRYTLLRRAPDSASEPAGWRAVLRRRGDRSCPGGVSAVAGPVAATPGRQLPEDRPRRRGRGAPSSVPIRGHATGNAAPLRAAVSPAGPGSSCRRVWHQVWCELLSAPGAEATGWGGVEGIVAGRGWCSRCPVLS
jgi:hypothetical protein